MYILDKQKSPVRCADLNAWEKWRDTAAIDVARTEFVDGSELLTWFVGMDLNTSDTGPPLVFESMLLVHTQANEWELTTAALHASWDEAEAGHRRIAEEIGCRQVLASSGDSG